MQRDATELRINPPPPPPRPTRVDSACAPRVSQSFYSNCFSVKHHSLMCVVAVSNQSLCVLQSCLRHFYIRETQAGAHIRNLQITSLTYTHTHTRTDECTPHKVHEQVNECTARAAYEACRLSCMTVCVSVCDWLRQGLMTPHVCSMYAPCLSAHRLLRIDCAGEPIVRRFAGSRR